MTLDTARLSQRTEYWARLLTARPSVTGTADEAAFGGWLAAELTASGVFSDVGTLDVPGGPHGRKCVVALARGSEGVRRTMVLTGHFDTVSIKDYGDLRELARDPDALRAGLLEVIGREPADTRSARARDDLASGAFLPGRGLLDMKAGLAAGLAVIEALRGEHPAVNLLFIAVPDEEGNSAGARWISQALPDIGQTHGLDIEAVINLDAMVDDGDGSQGRCVALGSVGKLLPSALVVGRPAHASASFHGFGAAALAGALAAQMEWLPDLTDQTPGEPSAGATLLGMKDAKTAYDVTMPAHVWMYWNVMVHRRSPEAILSVVETTARAAADAHLATLAERAGKAGRPAPYVTVPILRYELLLSQLQGRADALKTLDRLASELAGSDLSLPDQCGRLTARAWELSGRSGPAIVLGFASVPYLPVELRDDPLSDRLRRAVEQAIDEAGREGCAIRTMRYFPGISDLSFFGQADNSQVPAIAANTPQWRAILTGTSTFGAAGTPGINAGPWGRDYHTKLERMDIDYGFKRLPRLLARIVQIWMSERNG